MRFSGDIKDKAGAKADFGLKFVIADAGVSYLLVKTESEDHPFLLAGTLGVRYWYEDTTLVIKDSLGNRLFEGSDNQYLVDPMVGLRGSQYFTKKFHLDFAGDIGGFGIADQHMAKLDWSATGILTYDFFNGPYLSGGLQSHWRGCLPRQRREQERLGPHLSRRADRCHVQVFNRQARS